MKSGSGKIVAAILVLVVLTAATFFPVLRYGFVNWDDPFYLHHNPRIRDLSPAGVVAIFTGLLGGTYEPLTELTFALERYFFGFDPFPYHLHNLILHLLNVLLVFWLVYLLGRSFSVAFLSAAIFAVHPLRVESVAWVTERKDLLYGLFALLLLVSYLYYQERRTRKLYLLSLLFFVFSLLPKGQGLLLPLLLFLCDYFRGRKITRRVLLEKVPFLAVSALFFVINVSGSLAGAAWDGRAWLEVFLTLLDAAFALVFYLIKLLYPVRLSVIYPYPDQGGWGAFSLFTLAPAILLTLALVAFYSLRYSRRSVFALLFFLVSLALVLQVGPIVNPNPSPVSDRYTYLAAVGLGFLAASGLVRLRQRLPRGPARLTVGAAVGLVLLAFLVLARARSAVWADSSRLWSDVLKQYPDLAVAHHHLAWYYEEAGAVEEALAGYREALRLDPDFYLSRFNLGSLLIVVGRPEEGVGHLQEALRLDPGLPETHYNLGLALSRLGRVEEAATAFRAAAKLAPDYPGVSYHLGRLAVTEEDWGEAEEHWRRAALLDPANAEIFNLLGIALSRQGKSAAALDSYREAILLCPDYAAAHHNLGLEYSALGRKDEARESFAAAGRLDPALPGPLPEKR